ncbi:MAG: hypothetical protein JXR56_05600 [Candidatus Cloacimonetes bacterium]|nr:hypothetical protein [Candidatus Cloacimonadota bacterium]
MRYFKCLVLLLLSIIIYGCDDGWGEIQDLYWATTWDVESRDSTKLISNREELGSARYIGQDDKLSTKCS